ncbi:hypothetical protein QFZ81_003674 [Paenibacillus sp. V4I9]|nr:hypothetical protein [Paenibacillus sp. V4I9]
MNQLSKNVFQKLILEKITSVPKIRGAKGPIIRCTAVPLNMSRLVSKTTPYITMEIKIVSTAIKLKFLFKSSHLSNV